jgi:hypothetical protein
MYDATRKYREREPMELAVRLAEKSAPENDGRSRCLTLYSRNCYI